ncbi:MAG: CcmD family protein [Candidatus Acidiferrales bacterium]
MKNFESLFAAYLIIWVIFMVYEISVGQRLSRIQAELQRLRDLVNQK